MATYTSHYNLKKPGTSDYVNVADLNGNFDTIDQKIYEAKESGSHALRMIADAYSTSETYAVGDYCEHNGTLYRCNTAISTAESWTSAHWTEVTVGDELGGKIDATQKGAASGVATLNESGKIPSSQLPSYVDDIVDGYYYNGAFYEEAAHTTEITPETGKIYVDLATDKSYRWSGSAYVRVDEIDIDATPTQNSTNAVESGGVYTALGTKVDKVQNKGLSTNDYDNTAKGKVDALKNLSQLEYEEVTL